jgi:hypothetical protein
MSDPELAPAGPLLLFGSTDNLADELADLLGMEGVERRPAQLLLSDQAPIDAPAVLLVDRSMLLDVTNLERIPGTSCKRKPKPDCSIPDWSMF